MKDVLKTITTFSKKELLWLQGACVMDLAAAATATAYGLSNNLRCFAPAAATL
jgi:hypothetical protein